MLPFPTLVQYGNTVIYKPYNVLMSLENFNSTADIVDRSGNNITITNAASLPVSSNSYGTYINFNATQNAWFSCKDPKLDISTNCEVYYKISGVTFQGSRTYGSTILDTRPQNTNGNYFILADTTNINAPIKLTINVNNTTGETSTLTLPTDPNIPIEIRIRFLSTGTQVYVNDVLFVNSTQILNVVNQYFTVGRNAFYQYGEVPYLNAKLYKFEIRQLLNI